MSQRLDCFDVTRQPGVTDEHRALQAAVRRFVEQEIVPNAAAWDEAETFPRELYDKAAAIGLLGLGFPAEYGGTPCQIRMDWFDLQTGIVDLKTVDSLDYFEADARRYGYCHQLAFYVAVLQQRIGIAAPAFFIAVEKREPFRAGVWKVTSDVLAAARRENEAAIRRLRDCLARNDWPTGYEDQRFFDCL